MADFLHDWTEWQNADNKTVEELVHDGGIAVRINQEEASFDEVQAIEVTAKDSAYVVREAKFDCSTEEPDFRKMPESEQVQFAADYMESDRNLGIENAHYVLPNQLMDFFASVHYEEAYEAAKALFVPQAEIPMPEEDSDKFETVHFSKNDVEPDDIALDVSEPNYRGTGYVNLEITLPDKDVRLNVNATDKKVSLEIALTVNDEKSNYAQIALKPEEAKEIFDVINEYCKQELGHDVHDEIRELRKGAERDERQKEKLPEPKHRNYEPER